MFQVERVGKNLNGCIFFYDSIFRSDVNFVALFAVVFLVLLFLSEFLSLKIFTV